MVNMTTANELYSECVVFFFGSSDQEQREFEAIAHVRDSVQMVENAILERDQVWNRRWLRETLVWQNACWNRNLVSSVFMRMINWLVKYIDIRLRICDGLRIWDLCCWLLSLKITIAHVNIARAFFFFTLRVQEINFFVCSQALVREQQKTQEVGRLQEVINKILREAGKRTREEVIVRRI